MKKVKIIEAEDSDGSDIEFNNDKNNVNN